MKTWRITSCLLLSLTAHSIHSQQQLQGKIVEISGEKAIPVPGIEVAVPGYDDDITNAAGAFTLYLPQEWQQTTITLKNSSLRIMRPALGEVKLPPSGLVEVHVCGAEKKRLLKKVDALESEVKKLQKQRSLSQRQIAELHSQMLDTILRYEQLLQEKEAVIAKEQQAGAVKSAQIQLLESQVADLERQVAGLERDLQIALEEKFLKQQEWQRQITRSLNDYLVKLKNLRDWLTHFDDYFGSDGAKVDFNSCTTAYGASWERINENYENYLVNVRNYWRNEALPDEAEKLFTFLLDEVHEKVVLQRFNPETIEPLQKLVAQPHNNGLRKKAKTGAANTLELLNSLIPILENKVEAFNLALRDNI